MSSGRYRTLEVEVKAMIKIRVVVEEMVQKSVRWRNCLNAKLKELRMVE